MVTLNKWKEARRRRTAPTDANADLADVSAPEQADALWDQEYRQYLVSRALEVMKTEFQPATWQACWAHIVEGKPAAEQLAGVPLHLGHHAAGTLPRPGLVAEAVEENLGPVRPNSERTSSKVLRAPVARNLLR